MTKMHEETFRGNGNADAHCLDHSDGFMGLFQC